MEDPVRILQSSYLKSLSNLWDKTYPMLEGWIPKMIQTGHYTVVDSKGTRLPAEEAVRIIKS